MGPDAKPRGYSAVCIAKLLNSEKSLDILTAATALLENNDALQRHFGMYGTDEVFNIYRWTKGTASANPTPTESIDLFSAWHECTPEEVVESTEMILKLSNDQTLVQDITWSYGGVMSNILDPELACTIKEAAASFPSHVRMTGPLAFKLLMDQLTKCSQRVLMALRHRLFYNLKLTSIPGASIPTYNNYIIHIIDFLSACKVDVSEAPYQVLEEYN